MADGADEPPPGSGDRNRLSATGRALLLCQLTDAEGSLQLRRRRQRPGAPQRPQAPARAHGRELTRKTQASIMKPGFLRPILAKQPKSYRTTSRITSISRCRVLPGTSSDPSITGLPRVSKAVFCKFACRITGSPLPTVDCSSETPVCCTSESANTPAADSFKRTWMKSPTSCYWTCAGARLAGLEDSMAMGTLLPSLILPSLPGLTVREKCCVPMRLPPSISVSV